jgi:hypothetical protein
VGGGAVRSLRRRLLERFEFDSAAIAVFVLPKFSVNGRRNSVYLAPRGGGPGRSVEVRRRGFVAKGQFYRLNVALTLTVAMSGWLYSPGSFGSAWCPLALRSDQLECSARSQKKTTPKNGHQNYLRRES